MDFVIEAYQHIAFTALVNYSAHSLVIILVQASNVILHALLAAHATDEPLYAFCKHLYFVFLQFSASYGT